MSDAPAEPQCPTCEFNVPETFYIGRDLLTENRCRKRVVLFPHATDCFYYQRAPGAD